MYLLIAVLILTAGSLLLALLVRLVLWLMRRRPRRYWRRVLQLHLLLVPTYTFVVIPGVLGYLAVDQVRTRGDESAYAGPRVAADGSWALQSRASLAEEARGRAEVDAAVADAARALGVSFRAKDGVNLHGYLVPARGSAPPLSVVLTHGLWRGALEIESVGAMFHAAGCEVLLLELRGHGQSDHTRLSFGDHEARDVQAAVDFLRARAGHEHDPVILFGVSLGAAAIARAAPHISKLAGLVLDAPTESMGATARRMLDGMRPRGRRGFRAMLTLPPPFPWLLLRSIELWSGVRLDDVRAIDDVARLPADLPALIIGGALDQRMPPAVVTAVYDALRSPPGVKELWIREGSDHGHVFRDDPDAYREHVLRLVERVREQLAAH